MTDIVERLRKQYYSGHHDKAFDKAANEIERLEHMKANLHGHIKRLEDVNQKLEQENAKLREALEYIVGPFCMALAEQLRADVRTALQKDEGE